MLRSSQFLWYHMQLINITLNPPFDLGQIPALAQAHAETWSSSYVHTLHTPCSQTSSKTLPIQPSSQFATNSAQQSSSKRNKREWINILIFLHSPLQPKLLRLLKNFRIKTHFRAISCHQRIFLTRISLIIWWITACLMKIPYTGELYLKVSLIH